LGSNHAPWEHFRVKKIGFRTPGSQTRLCHAEARSCLTFSEKSRFVHNDHARSCHLTRTKLFVFRVLAENLRFQNRFRSQIAPISSQTFNSLISYLLTSILAQNNLTQLTLELLISQKSLKRLFTQKSDFLPNDSTFKPLIQNKIFTNLTQLNNIINSFKFIKIKFLHF